MLRDLGKMKWWQWGLVALLILACVLGVALGVVLTQTSEPKPSPVPSTTVFPFPSLTISPQYGTVVLLHDTFQGPAHLPLTQHVPNAPVGIYWVPYLSLPTLPLELTGTGAASNLVDTSTSPASLIYAGANITSGKFTNLGYNPATDVLQMDITLAYIPTISPRPPGSETVLMFFALSRTLPQNDILILGLEYRLGQATSDPPSWSFGASTNYDVNGVNTRTQTIVDTGFVPGDPPLNTPIHFSFSITPNGHCVVECPELGVSAAGPAQPDIIPRDGFGMNSLSMYVVSTQEASTGAQPLHVPISEVLVTATYQLTSREAVAPPPVTVSAADQLPPVADQLLPPAFRNRLAALGWGTIGS